MLAEYELIVGYDLEVDDGQLLIVKTDPGKQPAHMESLHKLL